MSYVTDPELIKILNSKAGMGGEAISDPELIAELNKKAGIRSQEKYEPMHSSLLGDVPQTDTVANNFKKAAGYGTMAFAPEIKILQSILPARAYNALPSLSGAKKIGADALSSIVKSGAAGYGGSQILPGSTNEGSEQAGMGAAGITAALTPFTLALGSVNPYARIAGGLGLGTAAGYGVSEGIGGGKISEGAGGLLGALLALGPRGAKQLAAKNVLGNMTPEEISRGLQSNKAAKQLGLELSLGEKTGSPVLQAIEDKVSKTDAGNNIFYPFSQKRKVSEENVYQKFLNSVAPENAAELEGKAYQKAWDKADQDKLSVDVSPVDKVISDLRYEQNPASKIDQGLKKAQELLSPTRRSLDERASIMAPVYDMKSNLDERISAIQKQISEREKNPVESYFQTPSYREEGQKLQDELKKYNMVNQDFNNLIPSYMSKNNITPYESTLRGLHNAKLGIRGILESQGNEAIGKTASGALKQVNKELTNTLNKASPEYKQANAISNMRQARQKIEEKMASSSLTGSNFYDKILKNRNEYEKLYERLGDESKVPTMAQKNLKIMKEAFPDLMHNMSEKSAQSLAAAHMDSGFDVHGLAKSFLNKIYVGRYQKAIAELMTNPDWHDELLKLQKMKAGEDRGVALGRIISNIANTGVVANGNSQGSEMYGTRP